MKLRAHTKSGEPSHGYGIHHEITDHIDVVTSLPSLARRLGTGSHWAVIYTSTAKMLDLALNYSTLTAQSWRQAVEIAARSEDFKII